MIHEKKVLNLNYPTARAVWNVEGQTIGTLMGASATSAAWSTGTVILYRSNSESGPWFALETTQTLGPDSFMSAAFDIDFAYFAAEIVADETADEYVALTLWTGGPEHTPVRLRP